MVTPATELPPKPAFTAEQAEEMFRKFLTNRNVNAEQGGQQLYLDNYDLREKNRRLTEENTRLTGMVPAPGTIVISGDAVKAYNDLMAIIGARKPEELKTLLDEHAQLQTRVTGMEREQAIHRAAEAEGWKPSALQKLASNLDLVVDEVEEEQDDPEKEGAKIKVKVKRAFVQTKDGDKVTKTRLSEELKDFKDSLKLTGDKGKGSEAAEDEPKGTKFVKQTTGGKVRQPNASKDYIAKRYGKRTEAK